MAALKTALYFLITLFFNLYIYVLLLRLFMQKWGASWYNPLTQLVIKLTDPLVKPLRRIVPGFKGFDGAIILLSFVFEIVLVWLLFWLQANLFPRVPGTIVIAIAQLGMKVVNIFFYATIIGAILSWFPNLQRNPAVEIITLLTEPLLRITRRFIPIVAGFDFSPLFVIVISLLINILIFMPLLRYGLSLAI